MRNVGLSFEEAIDLALRIYMLELPWKSFSTHIWHPIKQTSQIQLFKCNECSTLSCIAPNNEKCIVLGISSLSCDYIKMRDLLL